MKNLIILLILTWGLFFVPTTAFSQIEWADKYIIPYNGPASGGFYGGDGDKDYPGQWIDWCIGNYVISSDLVTDDMIFSTNTGNFLVPGVWYERMRITNSGNIGIGTASPTWPLHVYPNGNDNAIGVVGSVSFYKGSGTPGYGLKVERRVAFGINWWTEIDATEIDTYGDNNPPLHLNFNSTADVTLVNGGGNVGIGTTIPASWAKLHVQDDTPGGADYASAVLAMSSNYWGVRAISINDHGVHASSTNSEAVYGHSQNGTAGYFISDQGSAGYFQGDVHITGALSKGSGSFVQPNAIDPSKEIEYAFFEGPEHAVFLRGSAQMKDGKAVIELPEHFRIVAAEEGVQVQVTPVEDCNGMFVVNKSSERIEVKELMGGKHDAQFDYFITAVRAGFQEHEPVVENTHFKPKSDETAREFERRFTKDDMTTRAMRNMLISNGILSEDGKLNMTKVGELGWTVAQESPSPDGKRVAELR